MTNKHRQNNQKVNCIDKQKHLEVDKNINVKNK